MYCSDCRLCIFKRCLFDGRDTLICRAANALVALVVVCCFVVWFVALWFDVPVLLCLCLVVLAPNSDCCQLIRFAVLRLVVAAAVVLARETKQVMRARGKQKKCKPAETKNLRITLKITHV